MAVKIRMKRTGTTNIACFRLVAADMRSPRDGKNLEVLGWYNPGSKGKTFDLKLDRIDFWLNEGAQISDTAASLVKKARKRITEPTVAAPDETDSAASVIVESPAAEEDAN